MKKTLSIVLVIILLVSGLFILTGCDNNSKDNNINNQNNNYETLELDSKSGGKLTFEFPKDSGYEYTTETNSAKLYNSEDKSSIEFFLMNTSRSSIIMKETDFSSSTYKDYQTLQLGGYEAFTITYHSGTMTRIEMGLLLDEYDSEHGLNHGLKIKVSQSSLDKEGLFNPEEYVKSDDFQHLLNSIKFEMN